LLKKAGFSRLILPKPAFLKRRNNKLKFSYTIPYEKGRAAKSTAPALGHFRAVDKPSYIRNLPEYNGTYLVKATGIFTRKKVMVIYAMAFFILFRFNAADDKMLCCFSCL